MYLEKAMTAVKLLGVFFIVLAIFDIICLPACSPRLEWAGPMSAEESIAFAHVERILNPASDRMAIAWAIQAAIMLIAGIALFLVGCYLKVERKKELQKP